MSTGATLVVFPEIPHEVQEVIASYCTTNTLVVLSGVNKSASEFLANERFFQERYFKERPLLKPYDRLFIVLFSSHPSNCWKVICQVLDPEWGYNPKQVSMVKRVSLAFMEEAHPKVVEKLQAQINVHEAKDKEICGLYYEDPSSKIDQAWKQFKKFEQEENAAWDEWHRFWRQLDFEIYQECKEKQVESDKPLLSQIRDQFYGKDKIFVSSSYEDFLRKDPENGKISKDQFCICQKMMRGSLLIQPLSDKITHLRGEKVTFCTKYHHLEAIRKINRNKKEFYTQKLAKFLSNPAVVHLQDLSAEWGFARLLELRLKSKEPLEKCRVFVKNLVVDHPEQQCPEAFEKLRCLVNECDQHYGTNIWEDLYYRCGRGVIEDSWAEKHFPDYLPELLDTIVSLLHDVEHKSILVTKKPLGNS